jgi:putative transposase
MCLRFVFLLAPRVPAWLRLSRRSAAWKDAEILLLRHQVALLECRSPARPILTWADRALFAALLAAIPRARHAGLRLPVTPATILRWHRDLVKRRWAVRSRRTSPGRPRRHPAITRLVLRMARDNENWGYRRITGELAGLGITVAPSTVWEILKRHGVDPAPRRGGPTWTAFLRSQAEAIIACDFFTVDLLDGTKAYVMAVIEHATRRIHILGATAHPTHAWVTQQVRNLLMDLDESADRIKFLIRDRDIRYPPELEHALSDAGITTVRSAVRAPRMNAVMERWIGGCRRELLDRTFIWNLPHLRRILREYETRHNTHRPHMALASTAPDKPLPAEVVDLDAFRARRHDRIAGVIREYHRAA